MECLDDSARPSSHSRVVHDAAPPPAPPSPPSTPSKVVLSKVMPEPPTSDSTNNATGSALWQSFLQDVVRSSIGLVAAEVWLREASNGGAGTVFRRPSGAWYVEPAFVVPLAPESPARHALDALSEQPDSTSTGLAAVLWESSGHGSGTAAVGATAGTDLRWQALCAMAANEDAPEDVHTQRVAVAFGGCVCALRLPGTCNASLLLFTRDATAAHPGRTEHAASATFLLSALAIGGAIAGAESARTALYAAKRARSSGMRKLRALHRSGMLIECVRRERERLDRGETVIKPARRAAPSALLAGWHAFLAWGGGYLEKWRGTKGGKPPAPPALCARAGWEAAAWTWFGVALTLLCLSALNQAVLQLSDQEYRLMVGSFGALMTLQYGAPSSPPRTTAQRSGWQSARRLCRRLSPLSERRRVPRGGAPLGNGRHRARHRHRPHPTRRPSPSTGRRGVAHLRRRWAGHHKGRLDVLPAPASCR